jgi:hypothetical protein
MPSVPAIGPGAITFERTPNGASSTARHCDVASTAAFAADMCAWYCTAAHKASVRGVRGGRGGRTAVVPRRGDVDVRPVRRAEVRKCGLDGVVRPELFRVRSEGAGKARARGRTVSISMTVRNAFSEMPEMGAMKLPAAPAARQV